MDKTREQIRNWYFLGAIIGFVIMCVLLARFGMGRAVDVRLLSLSLTIGYILMFTLPILFACIGYRRVR